METTTPSGPQSEANDEVTSLTERLVAYSWVNSMWQTYDSVKQANSLLKYSLETAEGITAPVLVHLDNRLGLEEKGSLVLDTIENSATAANKLYQDKKDEAVTQAKGLVNEANRTINHLLDTTEELVDRLLPPAMEFEYQEGSEEASASSEDKAVANPLPRVKEIGLVVPRRLKAVALSKIPTFDLNSAKQINSLAYVIDLIQFSADYVNVEKRKEVLLHAGASLKETVGTNLNTINTNYIHPVKEIIDKNTEDVKSAAIKTVVGIVASVAQAAEVVRRMLFSRHWTMHDLQEELGVYTVAAKNAISSMQEAELIDYLNTVKVNSRSTLAKLVELLSAYAPTNLTDKLPHLVQWSESISQRLSRAAEEILQKAHEGEPEETHRVVEKVTKNDTKDKKEEKEEKKQEEVAKKEEEVAKKEEAVVKKEEEVAKKEEEVARKEEEVAKKEEKVARKEEEVARKEEEVAKKEEEAKKEEARKAQEAKEERKKKEEAKKEQRNREEARKEEERKQEEAKKKEEEKKKAEEKKAEENGEPPAWKIPDDDVEVRGEEEQEEFEQEWPTISETL